MPKTIRDLVQGQIPHTGHVGQTVFEVAKSMSGKRVGAFPVLEEDRVVGIFTERDLMTRVVAAGLDPQQVLVDEVMTRELIVASPQESYDQALAKMQKAGIRHLIIVEGGELVGLVSLRDLMQVDIHAKSAEIDSLNEYIHYSPSPAVQR